MKWLSRAKSGAPEKRAISGLGNPEGWLTSIFTGGQSSAGVPVNEVTAMGLPAVYACIRLLSETVAQLPLNVYRLTDNGKELAKDHPVNNLISFRPNAEMSSFVWRDTQQGHAGSWGNGYAYVERNKAGVPLNLVPLLPDRTYPVRVGRDLVYCTTPQPWDRSTPLPEGTLTVPATDVVHIPAFGYDGIMGYSPIRLHAEAIGLGLAAQKFGATFFGNGATLSGILEHPGKLTQEAQSKIASDWDSKFAGTDNAYRTGVLMEGMKYTRIGVPPEEAQFVETRKMQRSEVATIYNIPPHMIGDLEKASFSNITEQSIEFLRYTMAPWLVKWEQELERKLLSEREIGRYVIRFDSRGLLKGTPADQSEALQSGILTGYVSRNEGRDAIGLNPVEGLDEFLVPLNMEVAGQQEAEPEPRALLAPFAPMVRRVADQIDNAAGKASEDKLAALVVRNLEPLSESVGLVLGCDEKRLLAEFADKYTTGCDSAAVLNDILEGMANGS